MYSTSQNLSAAVEELGTVDAWERSEGQDTGKVRNSWPFRNLAVGESAIFRESETDLKLAAIAAKACGKYHNRVFQVEYREVEGERYMRVRRLASPEGVEEPQKVDGRSRRRVRYGYEDLEVGEFVEYRRDEDGRKAVSGIYNRQRELGRTFSVRKYEGTETNGTFQFPITITRITRIN